MKKAYEKLCLGVTGDVDVIATSGNGDSGDGEYKDDDTMPDWDEGLYNL